jgi:hypothetical protein
MSHSSITELPLDPVTRSALGSHGIKTYAAHTSRQKEPSLCHSGPTELKPWFGSFESRKMSRQGASGCTPAALIPVSTTHAQVLAVKRMRTECAARCDHHSAASLERKNKKSFPTVRRM